MSLTLTKNDIGPTLDRWATVMKKSMPATLREGGKRITKMLIALTPPANAGSGNLTGSAEAYRVGRLKIAGQMSYVLAPIRLKGSRKITTVFGHRLAKPVSVKTRELWPDVAGIYRASTRVANSGFGIRARVGHKFYVDGGKFKKLLTEKLARVGVLASGWANAANALGVSLPAWISRHGTSHGAYIENFSGDKLSIRGENIASGVPSAVRAELARRIPYAVKYVERGMRDNIRFVALKAANSAGLKQSQ